MKAIAVRVPFGIERPGSFKSPIVIKRKSFNFLKIHTCMTIDIKAVTRILLMENRWQYKVKKLLKSHQNFEIIFLTVITSFSLLSQCIIKLTSHTEM